MAKTVTAERKVVPTRAPAKRRAGGVKTEAGAPGAPGLLVGAAVRKRFGRSFYNGRVASFDAKVGWFLVKYDDGDEEELEEDELKEWLVDGKAETPTAQGSAAAAARGHAGGRAGAAVKAEVKAEEDAAPAPAAAAALAVRKGKAKLESDAPAVPAAAAASGRGLKAEAAASKRKAEGEEGAPAAAAPAKNQKKAGKKGNKVKQALPEYYRSRPVYLPLRTKCAARWRTGKPLGGIGSLVGTWHVYAAHHYIAGCECFDALLGGEAMVASSGSLVLSATVYPESLTGVLTALQIGSDDDFGPVMQHATVDVHVPPEDTHPSELRGFALKASSSDEDYCHPTTKVETLRDCGVFAAKVRGYSGDGRWAVSWHDDEFSACVDLNGAEDEQVPQLSADGQGFDSAEAVEAELEECIDRTVPPLRVCKGNLRLDVRWQERGGHSDAGCGIAYLLRRADGAAAGAALVGPPCQPEQSFDEHLRFRYRDHGAP